MSVSVYAIRNRSSSDTYIGTTKDPLEVRFRGHKYPSHAKRGSCSSWPIVQCPTAYIELLEECDESVRYERERWWIENTPNCVNKNRPYLREGEKQEYLREWYQEHREEHIAKSKAYVEANRERIREYQRAYRQAHKEDHNARNRAYRAAKKATGSAETETAHP